MSQQLRITITFAKEYEDVYHALKKEDNASKFICRLIKNEINQKDTLEKKIDEILFLMKQNPPKKDEPIVLKNFIEHNELKKFSKAPRQ
jgi:hypothetical protein